MLLSAAASPWILAGDKSSERAGKSQSPHLASDRVIVNDVVYGLEWHGDRKLHLSVQSLSRAEPAARRIETTYQIDEERTVAQIEIRPYRNRGLIAALKLIAGDQAEFAEMSFWLGRESELNGQCSAHKFLIADKNHKILGLTNLHNKGILVVVGKYTEAGKDDDAVMLIDGYLFHDGCPWPCNGGLLSRFKGKSLPIDTPAPFDGTKR